MTSIGIYRCGDFPVTLVAVCTLLVLSSWMRSYLSGRCYTVRFAGTESLSCCMLYGVSQGSVLGPLLFVLFTYTYDIESSSSVDVHLLRQTEASEWLLTSTAGRFRGPTAVSLTDAVWRSNATVARQTTVVNSL